MQDSFPCKIPCCSTKHDLNFHSNNVLSLTQVALPTAEPVYRPVLYEYISTGLGETSKFPTAGLQNHAVKQ